MRLQRVLSSSIMGISLVFALRQYWEAPWYINTADFLTRPLLLFALPLGILGGLLWSSARYVWPWAAGGPPLLLGGLGLLMQGGWPPPNTPTTWSDSYEQLGIQDVVFGGMTGLLWVGCVITCIWMVHQRRARAKAGSR